MHQDHLGVSLSSVSRTMSLAWLSHLDDNDVRDDVAGAFVESSVDLPHVVLLLTFSEREEAERFRIEVGIDSEDVEDDSRRGSVVSGSDDHSVAEDDDELPLVVVLESSQRVDGLLE